LSEIDVVVDGIIRGSLVVAGKPLWTLLFRSGARNVGGWLVEEKHSQEQRMKSELDTSNSYIDVGRKRLHRWSIWRESRSSAKQRWLAKRQIGVRPSSVISSSASTIRHILSQKRTCTQGIWCRHSILLVCRWASPQDTFSFCISFRPPQIFIRQSFVK